MKTPILRLGLGLLVAMTSNLHAQEPRSTTMAGRSTVYAPNGAIATSQPLATAAGLAVLQAGGNAIDAAVTAAAVLNVVEPHMTGMGGDLFALFWSAREQRMVGLDASGRAGALMTRETLASRGHERVPAARSVARSVESRARSQRRGSGSVRPVLARARVRVRVQREAR